VEEELVEEMEALFRDVKLWLEFHIFCFDYFKLIDV
jgi:hypothetical protein